MKTFKLSSLWHSKTKPDAQKNKPTHSTRHKRSTAQVGWDMSPEDALRVSYSGHK